MREQKNKRIAEYNANPKICARDGCGNPIQYRYKASNRFCSHSCAATKSNTERAKIRLCRSCGAKLKWSQKAYCSHKCQADYRYNVFVSDWFAGKIDGGRKSYGELTILSLPARRWVFEKYNSRCSKCGWHEINPTTGKSPLEIHHIDGDASNNRPENLDLLCPNCHSLTPTFGSLNYGKSTRKWWMAGKNK